MKSLLTIIFLLLFSTVTFAQNTELHVGASFTRSDPNFTKPDFHFDKTRDQLGFDSSVTFFFGDRPIGLTADVGATWKGGADDSSLVTIMGGPTLKARGHRVEPFVHGLVGVGRFAARSEQLTLRFNKATSGLAWAAGGGLDVNVSKRFAVRLLQVDYLGTRIEEKNVRYLRAGVGIVVRF